jgi:hypothetical protein
MTYLALHNKQNIRTLPANIFYLYMYSLRNERKGHQMLAFLPVSKARTNRFYIRKQCMYILYTMYIF